jgi:hypothetical protein
LAGDNLLFKETIQNRTLFTHVEFFHAENGLWLKAHPSQSPDLAPPDFFLFGHVKNRLQRITFQSHDELPARIVAVFGQIPIETLQRVFEDWTERLEWVSQNNGSYYP